MTWLAESRHATTQCALRLSSRPSHTTRTWRIRSSSSYTSYPLLHRRRRGRSGAIDGLGLTEDRLLCLSGGGSRFENPPERCAVIDRRMVRLADMVREEMSAAHEVHVAYLARLETLCNKFSHVRQFVDKRCVPRACAQSVLLPSLPARATAARDSHLQLSASVRPSLAAFAQLTTTPHTTRLA